MSERVKQVVKNFLRNPVSFLLRQIFRVLFFWPFQLVVFIMSLFNLGGKAPNNKEPSSFCFIITSIIYSKQGTIQYNSPRTVFSPEDRALQTVETIKSIRAKVPGAKIILVESGMQENLPHELHKQADQYIYVGDKKLVRFACDSQYKSLGEIMMLVYALKRFTVSADFYFKISGRYYLDDQFIINDWKQGLFLLQYIQEDYICTRLYGFRAEAFNTWKYALLKSIPLALAGYAVENTLAKYIPKKQVHRLERLGVTGIGASSNTVAKD